MKRLLIMYGRLLRSLSEVCDESAKILDEVIESGGDMPISEDHINELRKSWPRIFNLRAREWDDDYPSKAERAEIDIKLFMTTFIGGFHDKANKCLTNASVISEVTLASIEKIQSSFENAEYPISFKTSHFNVKIVGFDGVVVEYDLENRLDAAIEVQTFLTPYIENTKSHDIGYEHGRVNILDLRDWIDDNIPEIPSAGIEQSFMEAAAPIEFETASFYVKVNGVDGSDIVYFFSRKISDKTISAISTYIDGAFRNVSYSRSFLSVKVILEWNPDAENEINYAHYPFKFETDRFRVELRGPKLIEYDRMIEFMIERK